MSRKLEPTKKERLRQSTLDRLELDRQYERQTYDELINLIIDERNRYKGSYNHSKKKE